MKPAPSIIPDVLHFGPDGTGVGLYTEAINLQRIGRLDMTRASRVEFNAGSQLWEVFDFTGRLQFANASREVCLRWERGYFNQPHPQSKTDPSETPPSETPNPLNQ